MKKIGVIIPAFNEEKAIGKVLNEIPKQWVDEVVVVDNNSSDRTFQEAEKNGATALKEPRRGYGYACLAGIEYFKKSTPSPDIIVFLDGDYSDYPQALPLLIAPILEEGVDMVIGSRKLGNREKGSMTPQQRFGNWLATFLIKVMYRKKFTDLGPFRAITFQRLLELNMQDKTYGWTVEMQVKAAKNGLPYREIPVNYRKRIGFSKVSGTVKGTIMAGVKIIATIIKHA